MRLAMFLMLLGTPALAAPVQVAPRTFVIVHPDATDDWPNGNTSIVIGDRGVLVVDAGYLPSVARADIAEIKKLTTKPVKWLVNTHWHYDHTDGDIAYKEAFPDVEIIVSAETRRLIETNVPRWVKAAVAEGSAQRKALAELKTKGGDAKLIAARERELAEFATWKFAAPATAFRDTLELDLGGRSARVLTFGRGNTPGDAVVFLEKEKVLIAGDLVVAPVPYCFYSYPAEWASVLGKLRALGATTIVPGHGEVMKDDGYVADVAALLDSATRQVAALSAQGKTADEVRKVIDLKAFHEKMVAGDATREETWQASVVTALVDRAWLWSRGGL